MLSLCSIRFFYFNAIAALIMSTNTITPTLIGDFVNRLPFWDLKIIGMKLEV